MPKSGSPKKSKSSPSKKGSSPKGAGVKELPPLVVKDVRRKLVWTGEAWPDYVFDEFRCPTCRLSLRNFAQFLAHHCWREYYQAKFHLGDTQVFSCRTCQYTFYSHSDYVSHECNDHKPCCTRKYREVEEVLGITYDDHFDFYVSWGRRTDWENKPHEPNWQFKVRCNKCSNKFKSKLDYMLHSCFQFTLIKSMDTRKLKTCMQCHYVFLNVQQYEKHIPFCHKDKAFCIDFGASLTEIACQQFVLGRHCYEFHHHLNSGAAYRERELGEPPGGRPKSPLTIKPGPDISVSCYHCGFAQPNLVEFFYHPCTAERLITPANLELILFCPECSCLFTSPDDFIEHTRSCSGLSFSFVRLNTVQLIKLALKRWSLEVHSNPYLPARQIKFLCACCKEKYRWFDDFLRHACPKRERFERLFIQPSALLETYTCQACHVVVFSAFEAVNHSSTCLINPRPLMIQCHYTMEEVLIALAPWMRGPPILQFDINIGLADSELEPYDGSELNERKCIDRKKVYATDKMDEFIAKWEQKRRIKQLEKFNPANGGTYPHECFNTDKLPPVDVRFSPHPPPQLPGVLINWKHSVC